MSSRQAGYTRRWDKFAENYRKAHPFCVLCSQSGLDRAGDLVDHILPADCFPSLFFDEDNVQTLCNGCHADKTKEDKRRVWHPDDQRLLDCTRFVVCGPIASGKTTYARSLDVDLVWDADAVLDSLRMKGGNQVPMILAMRKAVETTLMLDRALRFAMIITMREVAQSVANRIHAQVVEIRTAAEVCHERIERRGGGDRECSAVDDYYRRFSEVRQPIACGV